MAHGKTFSMVGGLALAALTTAGTGAAEAHGRGGGHVVVVHHGYGYGYGFGYAPFAYGWGFSPFYSPFWAYGVGPYYGPQGGVDMNVAMISGFGAIDVNVKPNRADVWVDGKYVGEARDLDGYPSYLWLQNGPHHVAVYKAGYRTVEQDVDVARGTKRELKLRLEPGESQPPGPKPDGERGKGHEKDGSKDAPSPHAQID